MISFKRYQAVRCDVSYYSGVLLPASTLRISIFFTVAFHDADLVVSQITMDAI